MRFDEMPVSFRRGSATLHVSDPPFGDYFGHVWAGRANRGQSSQARDLPVMLPRPRVLHGLAITSRKYAYLPAGTRRCPFTVLDPLPPLHPKGQFLGEACKPPPPLPASPPPASSYTHQPSLAAPTLLLSHCMMPSESNIVASHNTSADW